MADDQRAALTEDFDFLDSFLHALNDVIQQGGDENGSSSSHSTSTTSSKSPSPVSLDDFLSTADSLLRLDNDDTDQDEDDVHGIGAALREESDAVRLNRQYLQSLQAVLLRLDDFSRQNMDFGRQLKQSLMASVFHRDIDGEEGVEEDSCDRMGDDSAYPADLDFGSPDAVWADFLGQDDAEMVRSARLVFLLRHALPQQTRRGPWTPGERSALQAELAGQVQRYWLDVAVDQYGRNLDALSARIAELEQTESKALLLRTLTDPGQHNRLINWARVVAVLKGRHSVEECQRQWWLDGRVRLLGRDPDAVDAKGLQFSSAEREALSAMDKSPKRSFVQLKAALPGRTLVEIIRQWRLMAAQAEDASPTSTRSKAAEKRWTAEEDAILRDVVERRLKGVVLDWDVVSAQLPGRSLWQCRARYERTLNPVVRKGRWSAQEDALLRQHVLPYLSHDAIDEDEEEARDEDGEDAEYAEESKGKRVKTLPWSKIAASVPGRTDVQCRERWVNVLGREASARHPWTTDDDNRLMQAVEELGTRWSHLSRAVFAGSRSDNECMRRYRALSDARKRRDDAEKAARGRATRKRRQ